MCVCVCVCVCSISVLSYFCQSRVLRRNKQADRGPLAETMWHVSCSHLQRWVAYKLLYRISNSLQFHTLACAGLLHTTSLCDGSYKQEPASPQLGHATHAGYCVWPTRVAKMSVTHFFHLNLRTHSDRVPSPLASSSSAWFSFTTYRQPLLGKRSKHTKGCLMWQNTTCEFSG